MYYASSSTEAFAEGGAGEPSHGRAPAKSYAQTAGPEVSYQIVHLHTGSAVQMRLWHGLGSPQHPQHPRDPQDPQDPQDRQGAVRGPVCKEDRKRDPAAEGRPAAASHVLEGNAEVKGPAAGLHAGTGTRSAKACRTRARAHAHARARPALRCTITRAAAWAWQGGCRPGAAPSTAPPSSTKSHNRSFIQTIIPTFIEQSAAHSSVRTVSRRGPAVTTRATQLPPTPSTRL